MFRFGILEYDCQISVPVNSDGWIFFLDLITVENESRSMVRYQSRVLPSPHPLPHRYKEFTQQLTKQFTKQFSQQFTQEFSQWNSGTNPPTILTITGSHLTLNSGTNPPTILTITGSHLVRLDRPDY